VAQDRDRRWALVNTVMDLRVQMSIHSRLNVKTHSRQLKPNVRTQNETLYSRLPPNETPLDPTNDGTTTTTTTSFGVR
jgi:hypothetical protein